jgi:hypothetical protein
MKKKICGEEYNYLPFDDGRECKEDCVYKKICMHVAQVADFPQGKKRLFDQLTHQQKIDFITAKCAGVNPDIMEKKFGCRVRWDGEEGSLLVPKHRLIDLYVYTVIINEDNEILNAIDGSVTFLGRPITSSDILRMLNKCTKNQYVIDGYGGFLEVMAAGDKYKPLIAKYCREFWRKGDLRQQAEPTINWLYSTIGGE